MLDDWFLKSGRVGVNRWRFLLQALNDLDRSLATKSSRLLVIRSGAIPLVETLAARITDWSANMLCYESDTEPYAKTRDAQVGKMAQERNVRVVTKCSHTL